MTRPEPMPVPEDLGTDDNGNQWTRTEFTDDGDGDFTIGWTMTTGTAQ